MIVPLNAWLASTLRKAYQLVEDSDRKAFAERLFCNTIRRVWRLANEGAHAAPVPTLERVQSEDGVVLSMEWFDKEAGWHLCVAVKRKYGEKPRVVLDFGGNPERYGTENPTDEDILKALHDYFEEWKRT